MKKIENFKQRTLHALISAVCSIIIGVVLYPLIFGMPLTGLPKKAEVQRVVLEYGGETVTLTEENDVSLALNLTAYLKYKPFKTTEMDENAVTMTIMDENGTEAVLVGSENEVSYKGKTYLLKETGYFMKGACGLYFTE